jgi:hypothetical protein
MKVAVILTGALRTIKKTIPYLKRNLLYQDVHIFACVQNDTSQTEKEWDQWFSEHLGDHLKSTIWFSLEKYPEWVAHREKLLEAMRVSDGWKNYLRRSGSMIEYFQTYLAYTKMCGYEQSKYDYIIRTRTDTIFNKPIDFRWLKWDDEEIENRLELIKKQLEPDVTDKTVFSYFMNTIISDDLISNIKEIKAEYAPCATETVDLSNLKNYIRNGRYILTIRKNNLYIIKRDLFCLIPSLAFMYGYLVSPNSDDCWFNAECQFRSACYHSCLTIFNYDTLLEDSSLRYADTWNENDYFTNGVCNPKMLYCVVRK